MRRRLNSPCKCEYSTSATFFDFQNHSVLGRGLKKIIYIMILYHFTSVPLAEACMSYGISNGHIKWSDGRNHRPVVWLTRDNDWRNHGLLTGSEVITDSDRRSVELLEGRFAKGRLVANKTEIRITAKIREADSQLLDFRKFVKKYGNEPNVDLYTRAMGLSAIEGANELSERDFNNFQRNSVTKEKTWWLYSGVIEPEKFSSVQFLTSKGYCDYDFETHGRQICHQAGLVAPSASALSELGKIINREGKFKPVGAFCFCEKESDDPTVSIRKKEGVIKVPIRSELRGIWSDSGDELFARWVENNYGELMDCWSQSADIVRGMNI